MGKHYIGPLPLLILISLMFCGIAYSDDVPRFMQYQEGFHRIFPVGPEVKIVVDSERDGKPLRMTEGPTWLNDTLFFSDQPRGLHSLRPDGVWSNINHQGWTCGTAPLKNGNLAV